jgi:hypothetical protein
MTTTHAQGKRMTRPRRTLALTGLLLLAPLILAVGMTMGVRPAPVGADTGHRAADAPAVAADCNYGTLCLYEDVRFGGTEWHSSPGCGTHPVRDDLQGEVSSLINNLKTGTMVRFYDMNPNPDRMVVEQHAYGYRLDLGLNGANDVIDYFTVVC